MSLPSDEPKKPASAYGRSVVDYVTTEELERALATVVPPARPDAPAPSSDAAAGGAGSNQESSASDWLLPIPDPNCEEQTPDRELQRLLNLKSFMMLDAEKEEEFDKLTQEAREVFGVPTSLISLIDFGRQFLFSNTGADVRETNRNVAFCSYTILNKDGVLVVPDTKEDFRFREGELVKGGPKLRFYAGAPLISPEGQKLGTFCVEGPEPRPEGLDKAQQEKLKEYAAKTMEMMVERRKKLRDRLAADSITDELRKHAAVATSLGDICYIQGDLMTAMRLYQESVQTVMYVEEDGHGANPPKERQEAMMQLYTLLQNEELPEKPKKELMDRVVALYEPLPTDAHTPKIVNGGLMSGISGLFPVESKIKGVAAPRPMPELVFCDVFKIDMRDCLDSMKDSRPLEQLDFTVPLEECSKATLFNMGEIQYHWGNQEAAMQFFHLAASVSHKMSPLAFDPVDISCINNMAQIHLQYGQPDDAMKMLVEALERGNRTLAAMYRQTEVEYENTAKASSDGGDGELVDEISQTLEERDAFRTRRLRRKLARTLLNISHVHYYNGDMASAMKCLHEAIPILDKRTMTGRTMSAIWYNMSLIFLRQGKLEEALSYLTKFLNFATALLPSSHLQLGDAFHQKAIILAGLGKAEEAMEPIEKAIQIREEQLGSNSTCVAESLELKGKILLAQEDYDGALDSFKKSLNLEVSKGGELNLEAAQTMLEMGRAYHSKGDAMEAVATYTKVLEWTRKHFGPKHAFVARVAGIVGSIYTETGKVEESKPFLEEAQKIQQSLSAAS